MSKKLFSLDGQGYSATKVDSGPGLGPGSMTQPLRGHSERTKVEEVEIEGAPMVSSCADLEKLRVEALDAAYLAQVVRGEVSPLPSKKVKRSSQQPDSGLKIVETPSKIEAEVRQAVEARLKHFK